MVGKHENRLYDQKFKELFGYIDVNKYLPSPILTSQRWIHLQERVLTRL